MPNRCFEGRGPRAKGPGPAGKGGEAVTRRGGLARAALRGPALPISLLVAVSLAGCATQAAYEAGARHVLEALRQELQAAPPPPAAVYRLPVVSQVEVPDAIVGGVLIPRHETYVVLQPGAWTMAFPGADRPQPTSQQQAIRWQAGEAAKPSPAPAPPARMAGDGRPPATGGQGGEAVTRGGHEP